MLPSLILYCQASFYHLVPAKVFIFWRLELCSLESGSALSTHQTDESAHRNFGPRHVVVMGIKVIQIKPQAVPNVIAIAAQKPQGLQRANCPFRLIVCFVSPLLVVGRCGTPHGGRQLTENRRAASVASGLSVICLLGEPGPLKNKTLCKNGLPSNVGQDLEGPAWRHPV